MCRQLYAILFLSLIIPYSLPTDRMFFIKVRLGRRLLMPRHSYFMKLKNKYKIYMWIFLFLVNLVFYCFTLFVYSVQKSVFIKRYLFPKITERVGCRVNLLRSICRRVRIEYRIRWERWDPVVKNRQVLFKKLSVYYLHW